MQLVKAFAPANISLIFKVLLHKDPSKMGSLGVGFTVNKGVIVTVNKSNKTEVFFNKKPINLPTVISVAKALTSDRLKISIVSSLPLGSGFGISGASALASALAMNTLLGLNKSKLDLAKVAHTAEVENKTGLGDVVNQYVGGFLVKFVTSSKFKAQTIPMGNIPIYCVSYGRLLTSSVLTDPALVAQIKRAADYALQHIKNLLKTRNPQFSDIIGVTKNFAIQSNLLTSNKLLDLIESIEKRGGHASMIMLGEAVVSDVPFRGATKLFISETPAHVISY